MADDAALEEGAGAPKGGRAKREKRSAFRVFLRREKRRLLRSDAFLRVVSALAFWTLRLIERTQRRVPECIDSERRLRGAHPSIVAVWHGQHLLAPFFRPKDMAFVALLSKNADAEVNARVVERFGVETVRGSGGRQGEKTGGKGGARALIVLRRRMAEGTGVVMIADISKATAREAGLGIVTLARITGRPIIPSAAVTSRRYVIRRTWDRTTIPLPFGRMAVVTGAPIFVPADAGAETMEAKRREVTAAIDAAGREALELVRRRSPA